MSAPAAFAYPGHPVVTPRIFTPDVAGVVRFMREVLGAEGEPEGDRPAEMRLGDGIVLVSDGGGVRAPMPACLYVYVPDVDAALARAVALGAAVEEPVELQFWGDRRATLRDPFGNVWQIATHVGVAE